MSLITRFHQPQPQGRTTAEEDLTAEEGTAGDGPGSRRRLRSVVARVTTYLACLLVLLALIAPDEVGRLTPGAFVRIPVEALLTVAFILVLPARARRVVAVVAGAALGVLAIWKITDLGFSAVLDRPFNPVFDWSFFPAAVDFLTASIGRAGAIGSVIGVGALAVAVLVVMVLSVLRLSRLVVRHNSTATGAVAALGITWVVCAVLSVQIVPGLPVAAVADDKLTQVGASLHDQEAFAAEASVDAFRDTPSDELLSALRGKDVIVSFVESYGRDAVEDPNFASQVGAVLDAGTSRLRAAGFGSRSAFLISPTSGGGSWLAHDTLMSGLWIDNQQRSDNLLKSDRLTLSGAFKRAGWRTVAVMPGSTEPWPEGAFFGYDKIYTAPDLGYRGPRFNWGTMPDQYTLSNFQRTERAAPGHTPVMAEIPLVSSHAPWTPIPRLVDWDDVGDGSAFNGMTSAGVSQGSAWSDFRQVRTDYGRSIEYSLNSLISYVEKYGDDDLVLVFLGDHQPAPLITGVGADRDVPITIVAHDPAVLDRISGWGWQDGLKPGPRAPVWQMSDFRDRFLSAFGSQPPSTQPPSSQPSAPPAR
ncbi:hypothetical protein GCM10023194_68640 [Planotetraspora phitsanulokensis]|uniref:Sulfatase N-terminal domain-containing protein n=1 Tax=Planotetraspora phitsanulokensis TaxID=575192 RepID=A0A8J3XKI1_9ACTN|nr:sulfatase-like hydrolase/transferase [Planotetraspora phitsanulokensis]GII39573.1 hypothetical protein Pph01_45760 [Planotetraspora phitsanulokensis]